MPTKMFVYKWLLSKKTLYLQANLIMSAYKYYLYITVCSVTSIGVCAQDFSLYLRNVRNCLYGNDSVDCVKEETVDILNETVYSEEPIRLLNSIDIVRNKGYVPEYSEQFWMAKSTQRSVALSDAIFNKIEEFFKSRTIQFRIGDSIGEGTVQFFFVFCILNIYFKKQNSFTCLYAFPK